MPELTDSGVPGLGWPESYSGLLPVLRQEWRVEGKIYFRQQLGAGKSGAFVYIIDITCEGFSGQAILKLDALREQQGENSPEAQRHRDALEAMPDYGAKHLPKIVHTLEHGGQIAILATVVAYGLEYSVPWFDYGGRDGLEVTKRLSRELLEDWNADYQVATGMKMPQELLATWLGHRLEPGLGRLQSFLSESCQIEPMTPSLSFEGHWYPNPLAFACGAVELPSRLRLRAAEGRLHGDLHGYNVLVQSRGAEIADYFLIDLAFYRDHHQLFFDHAYFEIAYLLDQREADGAERWDAMLEHLSPSQRRYHSSALWQDDVGMMEYIEVFRREVMSWIERHEAHRLSFLESQYVLARVAVGLNFTHKRVDESIKRRAFLYAAFNLKDYLELNQVDWPKTGPEYRIDIPAQATASKPSQTEDSQSSPSEAKSTDRASVDGRVRKVARAAVFCAVAAGLLLIAVLVGRNLLGTGGDSSTATPVAGAASEAGPLPALDDQSATSLAVLPFRNLNLDGDDSFADGLAIDIASVFARTGLFKIPSMSSAYQFKGRLDDDRAIGQALNVDYLLHGSVLRSGDDLEISVSLVRASDGLLIWSQTFEDTMDSVFATQQMIAEAVGAALATPLVVDADVLKAERTENPRAYELFVRGLALLEQRGRVLQDAMTVLERAVAINPNFAAAWASLSLVYSITPSYLDKMDGRPINVAVFYRKAKQAALRAQQIDPDLPIVRHALGSLYLRERQWIAAEDALQAALRNDPYGHRIMLTYAAMLRTVGKREEARIFIERAREIDPLNELYKLWAAFLNWEAEQTEENIEPIEDIFLRAPQFRDRALRIIIDHRARTGALDKVRTLIEACENCSTSLYKKAHAILDAATREPAPQLFGQYKDSNIIGYEFLYAVGGADVTLDAFQYYGVDANRRLLFFTVPWSLVSELSEKEAFTAIVDDMGLVDYWSQRGWPDLCDVAADGRVTCG
ncbi:MAG: hypothetical protein AAF495_06885 [Pseudomonadota bacterium]